nr:glycosyltransferase [Oscillospiraceae bacterium]
MVIAGSAPERLVRQCILDNKLVFRYSERPLKHGIEPLKYLPRLVRWNWRNPPGKPIFLLCASAFAVKDYACFGLFRGKAFRWGYFPETRHYQNLQALVEGKRKNSILWAGRLLDWKHPEDAVRVAVELKKNGVPFDLNIIGTGEREKALQDRIVRERLEDCVHLLGAMKPEEVRRHMEESEIFLFTSDRREGWGAVLNEAMNSGCAAVASHTIGAVPYLVKDGENGMIYPSGNVEALYNKVRYLLESPEERCQIGMNAVKTIAQEWNGEVAARRLVQLIQAFQTGEAQALYQTGPCSPAEILEENWYAL